MRKCKRCKRMVSYLNSIDKKRWCSRCKYRSSAATRALHRNRYVELKRQVFEHYGSICTWCKEDDATVICLDHVHNDGWKGRQTGRTHWLTVVKSGFPAKYQALCANCNLAKKINNGVMPQWRKNKYGLQVS